MSEGRDRIGVRDLGGARVLRMPGRLDARAESEVVSVTDEALGSPPTRIVLDFQDVTSTDSAGIGLLFELLRRAREQGVPVVVAALDGQPRMVLERVRLPRYIDVFDTVESAVSPGSDEAPA